MLLKVEVIKKDLLDRKVDMDQVEVQTKESINSRSRIDFLPGTELNVNILGSEWRIMYVTPEIDDILNEDDGGYADYSTKTIVIRVLDEKDTIKDHDTFYRQTTRHEIIHAYFYESGLWTNTSIACQWSMNEEMVDWLALQFPKIAKTFKSIGCLC